MVHVYNLDLLSLCQCGFASKVPPLRIFFSKYGVNMAIIIYLQVDIDIDK